VAREWSTGRQSARATAPVFPAGRYRPDDSNHSAIRP
jgi:hypothetical protein